jgi:PIN domain nuclease of toxin-antitoxin system
VSAREEKLLSVHRWSISSIVLWELTKLHQLGRIQLDIEDPEFERCLSSVQIWPLDLDVCRHLRKLDFKSDPADELIAATSLAHNVPLLTRDHVIKKSRKVPLAE